MQEQDSWAGTVRLAFQCVGILYGDVGTSPLYVYSAAFEHGVGHPDDVLGVLSLIIYSFILFTVIKIAEDEMVSSCSKHGTAPSATLRRANWLKNLLETSKPAKISLFLLTILAIAMVISDAVLTPPISVLSAVSGLKEKLPGLTTDQIVWITVAILVLLFAIQRFGTDKVGYSFAPIILLWLLLIGVVGLYNLIKYDVGVLRSFNPKYIIDYFRRNKKEGWVSLGDILLVFTGTEALFANLGYFSIRSIQAKEMLENHDLKRIPGVGLFYTELVQGIPPIFPHLIEKIPTIHSVLIFVSIKHLHVPHVDASERFLFRQVEPKEYKVFRCVARYGYRDSLDEEADGFVIALVECLQYYIRDVNLYSADEVQNISYPISRDQSLSREKPSGRHAIHAEEMITPIQSFSELTTMSNAASNRLPQFQASKMNIEELAKIEEEQKFIQREAEKGAVYILGESEVVARPQSSLLKKIVVNYIYSFLRKNFMQGEKMLSIPHGKLLKVGISYEI
nr:unnamed protein product [Digitaria exilis]